MQRAVLALALVAAAVALVERRVALALEEEAAAAPWHLVGGSDGPCDCSRFASSSDCTCTHQHIRQQTSDSARCDDYTALHCDHT